MTRRARLIAKARTLLLSDQQDDAARILEALVKEVPEADGVWSLYLSIPPTDADRIRNLTRLLRACPHHRRAREALAALTPPHEENPPNPMAPPPRQHSVQVTYGLLVLVILVLSAAAILYGRAFGTQQQQLDQMTDGYTQLAAQHLKLQSGYETLNKQNADLLQKHAELVTDHNTLVGQHTDLQTRHQLLESNFTALKSEYEQLKTAHATLTEEHIRLAGDYAALTDAYGLAQEQYNMLYSDYRLLADTAITPPYIVVEGRQVYLAFRKTDQTLVHWEVPFEKLEQDIIRGYDARNKWLNVLFWSKTIPTNTGDTITVRDYSRFVDPEPFKPMMAQLYAEAPSDDDFIREAWNLVTQLSTYTSEEDEVPRYPMETLLAGGGDCEDTSILLASMLCAAPVNWDVYLVYLNSDAPYNTNIETTNHVIVYANTGYDEYWIETTSDWAMQPWGSVYGGYLRVH